MASDAGGKAEQAGDSAALELLARVGLVAYGVVHLVIGWLAAQLAWGAGTSKSADPSGAMRTLAAQPLGKSLLWLVAVGLVALALWQASEAIWGYRNRAGSKRVRKQVTSGGGLTLVLGHAESRVDAGESEMIQNHGQEELLRGVSSSGRRLV